MKRRFELRTGSKFARDYQKRQRKRKEDREKERQRVREGSSERSTEEEIEKEEQGSEEEFRMQKREGELTEEMASRPAKAGGVQQVGGRSKPTPPGSPKDTSVLSKKFEKVEKGEKVEKLDKNGKEEKEMLSLQKLNEKMDRMNEGMLNMHERVAKLVMTSIQGLFTDFKKEIKVEVGEMRKEFKTEITGIKKRLDKNENDARNFEKKVTKTELKLECHEMQMNLRLRGVPEMKYEQPIIKEKEDHPEGAVGGIVEKATTSASLVSSKFKSEYEKIVEHLADFLEKKEEAMEILIDKMYRINSFYAKSKNLPRDIIIQFIKKSTVEEIMKRQVRNRLRIEGREIRIMREVPRQVLADRKRYRKLTDKLKELDIRFRWELPEGLSFVWDNDRKQIESVEDMEDFLKEEKL